MESVITILVVFILVAITVIPYLKKMRRREREALEAQEKGKLISGKPQAQHPHIDVSLCVGCGTCVSACPEGDVLAVIGGKSTIINGYKCIGHGLCADACPTGAITIVMASPSVSADLPMLTENYETNVKGIFIVGELGGMALIKNAINQGRDCVTYISTQLASSDRRLKYSDDVYDVLIVGAGPAGISASLTAIQNKIRYITIDQDDIGGTVRQYPRQKLVLTSPVELPMYGKFKKLEISKEDLLEFWEEVFKKSGLKVNTQEKVLDIKKEGELFFITTSKGSYKALNVILALGKRGTPRKLDVTGEKLDKVYYRLIEADHYKNCNILIVGGGDSAIESAMGLATQPGNRVTISYRGDQFTRIKDRNAKRIQQFSDEKKVEIIFQSKIKEIKEKSILMDNNGETKEIPNDFVWIFAGGEAPNKFLEKIGIQIGAKDVTNKMVEVAG